AGGYWGITGAPHAGGGSGVGKRGGRRCSSAMQAHLRSIKKTIDANIVHRNGSVGAPPGGTGQFPYGGPLILPSCYPTLPEGAGLPDTSSFPLKAVFAWVPEYLFPALAVKGIPCPNCGAKGGPDGWSSTGQRRVHMEHDVAYLIGFRYMCGFCAAHNRTAKESEKRTVSFHAWDPACLKRLPEYVSREFPFILTRRSGIDTRLVDNPAEGVVSGRGFAKVAKRIRQEGSGRPMRETRRQAPPESFIAMPRTPAPDPSCRTPLAASVVAAEA
ncbi:unnamed protein product, partial [Laminaria digitata]